MFVAQVNTQPIRNYSTAPVIQSVTTQPTQPTASSAYASFWNGVITKNPQLAAQLFTPANLNYIMSIIRDYTLAPDAKFKKIFGVDLSTFKSTTGLGDIFSDVGSFFSNLFSSSNMSSLEDFFRTGANQFNNSANLLQYSQNQPNPQQLAQQQNLMNQYNLQSQNTFSNFMNLYGTYVFIGAGILLVVLLSKK